MKKQWKVFLGFILVLLIVIFALSNSQEVPVNFLIKKFYLSLVLVIIGSALIGALVVMLTSGATLFQQRKEIKQLKETIQSYETNNEQKLAEEKAAFQRKQENEIAVLKANYESLLKEKDQALAEKENAQAEKKNDPPIDYYD
ncbi:lipopolysaccharide assembly protein LapA domain-containing protein [Enterococcus dongliensis]|uniref:Lipopolysaccharide assembly protein LapA domain-containing protein n=1 Tax=Enterococcus dongliensis TaxID=2559925 RepID=A0AAP5KTK7_9ENTE|nr:lipopolysaccharide assembly protein LapA domain-containing protein [Enterococcus dongliensis]MDT2595733.1 lipopolysaccharide assembly protein LapA domain-containing protein [Enterococcus dongliensis]MDT2602693.1 lipopolysaccharide assembly protein LapA domain-containing protein [Enterococcus dongliensis]MDT2612154.1 lipopolysaccharide assembly protein LapA domain-containing protein [Enterococcus dongliensis]MDT2633819.1 lipopolysaccharide assembly protein LapA domain-containing protein [Ente